MYSGRQSARFDAPESRHVCDCCGDDVARVEEFDSGEWLCRDCFASARHEHEAAICDRVHESLLSMVAS